MNLKKTALVCGVALSLLSLSSFNTVASASNKHHVTYSKLSKKNNKNVKSLNKKLRALKKQYKHANKHQRKILKKQINKLEHEIKTINKNNSHKKNNVSVNDQKLDNTNSKNIDTKNNVKKNESSINGSLNTILYNLNSSDNPSDNFNNNSQSEKANNISQSLSKQSHIDAYNAQHPTNVAKVNAYNAQHQANLADASAKQAHIADRNKMHEQRENDPVLTAKHALTEAKKAVKNNKDASALSDLKTKEENARKNYESVVARVKAQKAVAEKQSHADAYNAQHPTNVAKVNAYNAQHQANLADASAKQAHIADRNKMHEQRENDPVLTAKHALTEAKKAVKNNKDASALSDLKTKEENARKNYESVVARVKAQKAVAEKQSHADAYNAQHPTNVAKVNAYNAQHQANLADAAAKQAHIADRNKMHEQRENNPVLTAKHALTEAKKAVKNNKDASALSDLKTKEENARKNYESVVARVKAQKAVAEKQSHADAYNAQHPTNVAKVNAYNAQHQANLADAAAKQAHIADRNKMHEQRENDPVLTAKHALTEAKKAVKNNKDASVLSDLKTKEENARKNYESVVARIAAQKAVAEKQSHADAYNAQHQANLAEAAEKQAHIADRNKMHEQRENDPVLTAKHALAEAKKAVKNNKDASALSDLKTKEENARKNYESVVAHSQSQNNNIASM